MIGDSEVTALCNVFHRDVTCGKKEYVVKATSVSIELHKGVCVVKCMLW